MMNREELKRVVEMRHSTRTYDWTPDAATINFLKRLCEKASPPFGANGWKLTVSLAPEGTKPPSTYGVIKGARLYLVVHSTSNPIDLLSAGFSAEEIVLQLTAEGFDTCWIGGTFHSSEFADAGNLPVVAIISVGKAASQPRLRDRLMVAFAGSKKRIPLSRICPGELGKWEFPLEMLRLAPSSTNSQPWRAEIQDSGVEFHVSKHTRFSDLDLGIGLCHFALGCEGVEISGKWKCKIDPERGLIANFVVNLHS